MEQAINPRTNAEKNNSELSNRQNGSSFGVGVKEYFHIAVRNIKTRSLRSWLTILGIVIGVFLIVSLLSLSEGIKETITKQLKALGGEMIFIMPGSESNLMTMMMGGDKLESQDMAAIKKTPGVDKVLGMSYSGSVMRYKEESKSAFLAGISWKEGLDIVQKYQGWSLAEGRWSVSGKKETIIGQQLANQTFKQKIKPNTEITIKGRRFQVVGVLNSLGSKTDDSFAYIDMSIYQNLTGEKQGSAQVAMAKIEDGASVNQVAEDIKQNLKNTRKRRIGTDEADFAVITSDKMSDIAGNVLGVIQLAIMAFASIAIIVGGIGIMNTMFTSVRERTKEIGIMKAIGAKNSAVLAIFLFEAGIIGFSGGIGGTILGVIMAKAIEAYGQVHPLFYFSAAISPGLITFGLAFSFIVGCLSGFFPARKASHLKPVEALRRYE